MKNKTFLIAILPALLLAALLFSLPAKASNAVVYISDDGTGDGSSPSSPLRATSGNYDPSAASPKYHLDSVLYQAADKLKTTGGTIVFVGPVTLDIGNCYGNGVSMRDYPLPEWGARKITFTSFYDGVDYRETNGARLILKNPATLSIGGWAVFKNMDICTQGRDESHTAANRVIAAKGYTLYMDVGVRTYSLDDEGNEIYNPDSSFYPSLCGGNRYSNAAGDAIVLIKSGTYNRVAAGTYGISDSASGVLSGNAFVKIYDGVFFGMISGTSVDNPTTAGKGGSVSGNSTIEIEGGLFYNRIYACSPRGYAAADSVFTLIIRGGRFLYDEGLVFSAGSTSGNVFDNLPSQSVLDLSGCPQDLKASLEGSYSEKSSDNQNGFGSVISAEPKVIFISDSGNGDGSSPSSPLRAETLSDSASTGYKNSVLYQALEQMKNSGGTIVIVGDVLLDHSKGNGDSYTTLDARMPEVFYPVTITSVYGGVDYRSQNNARLILRNPINLILNGDTTFDDVNVCSMFWKDPNGTTQRATRTICANGHTVLFTSGVSTRVYDENGGLISSPSSNYYPSLAGADRYRNSMYDTDLTVLGGTWYRVCGGTYGISVAGYCSTTGTIRLTMGGTVSYNQLYGTNSASNVDASHTGNVYIDLTGGTCTGTVYGLGPGGLSSPSFSLYITVTGGSYSKFMAYDAKLNEVPYYSLIDFSGYSSLTSTLFNNCKNFTAFSAAPSLISFRSILTYPSKNVYYEGETFDASGLTFRAVVFSKQTVISYSHGDGAFVFGCGNDPLTEGMTGTDFYYNGKKCGTIPFTVKKEQTVSALGAMIKTKDETQGLRFVGQILKSEINGSSCTYGFLILPTKMIGSNALNFETISGMTNYDETGRILRGELNSDYYDKMYNNDRYLVFGAVYDDIVPQDYKTEYTAVAYLGNEVGGKIEYTYSAPIVRSVYSVALSAAESEQETEEHRKWIRLNVIDKADANVKGRYDAAKAYENAYRILDYMTEMSEIVWTPSVTIDYTAARAGTYGANTYTAGTTYIGLPYNGGVGDADSFRADLVSGVYQTTSPTWSNVKGVVCSTAPLAGWVRYCTSITATRGTNNMMPAQNLGFYAVGEYTWQGHPDGGTVDIITDSGKIDLSEGLQTIYRAFSLLDVGDMVVSRWAAGNEFNGHIRLVAEAPTVVYSSDGSIDANASYLITSEQTASLPAVEGKLTNWRIDYKYKFKELANSTTKSYKYIPVTVMEFRDGYFEKPESFVLNRSTAENISNGLGGTVLSNYDVSKITFTLKSGANVVSTSTKYYNSTRAAALADFFTENDYLTLPAGSYTITVDATIHAENKNMLTLDFVK